VALGGRARDDTQLRPHVVITINDVPSNWSSQTSMKKRNYWRLLYGQPCAVAIISIG